PISLFYLLTQFVFNPFNYSFKSSAHLNLSSGENFQGEKLISILENIAFQAAGALDSSIATYLLICKIIESGSMLTGQASTQAAQDVQAFSSSLVIQSSSKLFPSSKPFSPLFRFCLISVILSRVSIMIFLGDSFLPVMLAGHSAVHRPHSVHV